MITFLSGKKYSTIWKNGKPTKQVFDPPVVGSTYFNSKPEKADGVTDMYALIVGVSSYNHLPALKFPDDDAYHIYAFLKSPEGGALPESNISLLVDDVATKENIISSMKRIFGKADMDDVIIMYYSGHGLEGRLLPIDFDGYSNSLAHSEIYDLLDKSVAKNKILIADACHSGSMTEKKVEFRNSLDNFYTRLQSSKGGTAVIMSSKAEEKSLEYSGLRQGVFSHFLMRGMKGEADFNNNYIVSISELFNYTSEQVRMYTDNRQSPTISGTYDHNMPIAMIRQ